MLASYGPAAMDNYVISHGETASDMLEVYLLLKEAGLYRVDEDGTPHCPLRAVPLFETVAAWLADIGMEAMAEEFGDKTMADVMAMESEATEKVLQAAEDKGLANVHKMRTDLEQKTRPVITEIDLDASANFGDIVGLKWSSAYSPPELAALIYEYEQLPAKGRVAWEEYVTSHPNKVLASTAFDVWAFGMILYILCAHEGASVFLTSATDNIVRPEELRRLAYEWEEHKLEEVSKLVWAHAQDLALWCLQTDPSRRPSSFKDILDHPFLGGEGELRFLGDVRDDALAVFEEADTDDEGRQDAVLAVISGPAVVHLAEPQNTTSAMRDAARDRVMTYNLEYGLTALFAKMGLKWRDLLRLNVMSEIPQIGFVGGRDEADIFATIVPRVKSEMIFLERAGNDMERLYNQLEGGLSTTVESVLRTRRDELGVMPRGDLLRQIGESLVSNWAGKSDSSGGSSMLIPLAGLTLLIALARRTS